MADRKIRLVRAGNYEIKAIDGFSVGSFGDRVLLDAFVTLPPMGEGDIPEERRLFGISLDRDSALALGESLVKRAKGG